MAGAGSGVVLGLIAGLERWSNSTIEAAIAVGTLLGFLTFIALPDELRARRRKR